MVLVLSLVPFALFLSFISCFFKNGLNILLHINDRKETLN